MVTGMLTFDRSLPMFLYRKLKTEKSSLLLRGTSSFVLRPVKHLLSSPSSKSVTIRDANEKKTFFLVL